MHQPFPERFNETSHAVMGACMAQVITQGFTYFITQDAMQRERDHQREVHERELQALKLRCEQEVRLKELEMMGRAQYVPQPQPQPQAVNPYRNCQTVGQLEVLLLQQSASPQREAMLRDLAKYPETMPLAQLPAQTAARFLPGR